MLFVYKTASGFIIQGFLINNLIYVQYSLTDNVFLKLLLIEDKFGLKSKFKLMICCPEKNVMKMMRCYFSISQNCFCDSSITLLVP